MISRWLRLRASIASTDGHVDGTAQMSILHAAIVLVTVVACVDLPPRLATDRSLLHSAKRKIRAVNDASFVQDLRRTPPAPRVNAYACSQHDVVNSIVEKDIARIWGNFTIDEKVCAC